MLQGIGAGFCCRQGRTPARADCQPDPASSGQTVICAGVDHDGFVAGAGVNNLDVRVRANATVHDNGVVAIGLNNRNTVDNKGTIDTQGVFGILAGNRNTITNSNEIKVGATAAGIFVGNHNTVSNNGDITVGAVRRRNVRRQRRCVSGTRIDRSSGKGAIGIETAGYPRCRDRFRHDHRRHRDGAPPGQKQPRHAHRPRHRSSGHQRQRSEADDFRDHIIDSSTITTGTNGIGNSANCRRAGP